MLMLLYTTILTMFLITGVETQVWENLTTEQQNEFVNLLAKQYFEERPDCGEVHIRAEEKDGTTFFYGECIKQEVGHGKKLDRPKG